MNISVKLNKYHILSVVEAIKKILNLSDEIGVSNADVGLLHSTLTTLAMAYDTTEGDNKKVVNLEIEAPQARGAWHCCRMIIDNKLISNKAHQANIMEAISRLAVQLDKAETNQLSLLQE